MSAVRAFTTVKLASRTVMGLVLTVDFQCVLRIWDNYYFTNSLHVPVEIPQLVFAT